MLIQILREYEREGYAFLESAFADATHLERVSGGAALQSGALDADVQYSVLYLVYYTTQYSTLPFFHSYTVFSISNV